MKKKLEKDNHFRKHKKGVIMKKTLLSVFALIVFVGCTIENSVNSISSPDSKQVASLNGSWIQFTPGFEFTVDKNYNLMDTDWRLKFQNDGNFVLYKGQQWYGQTHTYDHYPKPTRCIFQTDGNLVLYAGTIPVWNSQTWGHPNARLWLNEDGHLFITSGITPDAPILWEFHGYRAIFPGYEFP